MLFQQVARVLDRHGFNWCECSGCFDIAARKRDMLMLKVLDNVDSLQESQAKNLIALSDKLDANVSLIGTHTRYEHLRDNVIYERFDVPTFTPNTLDAILDDRNPTVYRNRGGYFVEIDPRALRKARNKAGLTQQELADAVGVTKKSIYEHEARAMPAQQAIVGRIEKTLKESVSIPFEAEPFGISADIEPESEFERFVSHRMRQIGFSTSFVGQSPFNLIVREKVMVLSDAEPNPHRIERKAEQLESFADVSNQPVVIISNGEPKTNLPTISAEQLNSLSARGLRKIARK